MAPFSGFPFVPIPNRGLDCDIAFAQLIDMKGKSNRWPIICIYPSGESQAKRESASKLIYKKYLLSSPPMLGQDHGTPRRRLDTRMESNHPSPSCTKFSRVSVCLSVCLSCVCSCQFLGGVRSRRLQSHVPRTFPESGRWHGELGDNYANARRTIID